MVLGRRPEVPDPRLTGAGEQRPSFGLVVAPGSDVCGGDVANVGGLENKEGPEVARFESLTCTGKAIIPQARIVDSLFPIDANDAGCGD